MGLGQTGVGLGQTGMGLGMGVGQTGMGVGQTGMGVGQAGMGIGQAGMGLGMGAGSNPSALGAPKFGSSPMFAGIVSMPYHIAYTCIPLQLKLSLGQDQ